MNRCSSIPQSTYRLQFHAGFTFSDALNILDYLHDLGVSDIYSSPFFQASRGTTHGYDITDHNRFNPVVGNEVAFRNFVTGLHERNMGLLLDFVPNHMGISEALNFWWIEVLEDGPNSKYAEYFDIDWNAGRDPLFPKVVLPILGQRYGEVLESGELLLNFKNGQFSLKYYETTLPISPLSYQMILDKALTHLHNAKSIDLLQNCIKKFSQAPEGKVTAKETLRLLSETRQDIKDAIFQTLKEFRGVPGKPASFDALHTLLERQWYRLCYWRVAAEEINYRRFFDINSLAAIRVELTEVFEASHHLLFELLSRGDVTGLRIDHVDGLWNPFEYLRRLQDRYATITNNSVASKPLFLVVEKILDPNGEVLPMDWPVYGTTGYEFANQVAHVLVENRAGDELGKFYQQFSGCTDRFSDIVYEKKRLVIELSFYSEVVSLGRQLDALSELHRQYRDFTLNLLTTAVREVIASFPVYRTYVSGDHSPSEQDERAILRAVSLARRRNPSIDKPVFDFLRNVLLLRLSDGLTPEQREQHVRFVMRFQQCTGPVMAKGFEDTALYIYHRLVALNEVGGNPADFGMSVDEFHRLNAERLRRSPHTLLATSTHDTKRSEDVRMRIAALSEMPKLWRHHVRRWSRLNRKFRTLINEEIAPSNNEEYLLYQTLLGCWPLNPMNPTERKEFIERIQTYMLKALKEAKVNSSWTEPQEEWENAMSNFVASILDEKLGASFQEDFQIFSGEIARLGAWNSLSQTVLKCTLPGIPDIYQGNEIWDFSLVDPDNRRPVDFAERRRLLASLTGATPQSLMADWKSGRIKMFITQRLLTFRRERPLFFQNAGYSSVALEGPFSRHAIAFSRTYRKEQMLIIVSRLTAEFDATPIGDSWKNTCILDEAYSGEWSNVLSDSRGAVSFYTPLKLSEFLKYFPVAVLYRHG